jgi:hypothetical protein
MSITRWKNITIDNQEDTRYSVSTKGQIKNNKTNHMLKQAHLNGYKIFKIKNYITKKHTSQATHRSVAFAFINNPNNYDKVNHIDGNPDNNQVENLEWCTQRQNVHHAIRTGLAKTHQRRIKQLDIETKELVKVWDSIKEASEHYNVTRHAIIRNCKKKSKSSCGFVWEYEIPDEQVDIINDKDTKKIDGYDYYATKSGQIYSGITKKVLKYNENKQKQNYVTLSNAGKKKNCYVQQLIARAFIPNPNNCKFVRHINGSKSDNNVTNLEWY